MPGPRFVYVCRDAATVVVLPPTTTGFPFASTTIAIGTSNNDSVATGAQLNAMFTYANHAFPASSANR